MYYPDDFYVNVARGLVKGVTSRHIFGAVPQMSIAATGSIWEVNDTIYPWDAFSANGEILTVPSVDVGDNGKFLTIYGLDAEYNEIQETLVLSSSSATSTNNSFLRINDCIYSDNGVENTGIITIRTGGAGGTIVGEIDVGKSQTYNATYTVPAGYTGYVMQGVCTCESGGDASVDFKARQTQLGDLHFRTGHTFEITAGGEYRYPFTVPMRVTEKSDLDVVASVRTNNSRVTVGYDIILVREGLQ